MLHSKRYLNFIFTIFNAQLSFRFALIFFCSDVKVRSIFNIHLYTFKCINRGSIESCRFQQNRHACRQNLASYKHTTGYTTNQNLPFVSTVHTQCCDSYSQYLKIYSVIRNIITVMWKYCCQFEFAFWYLLHNRAMTPSREVSTRFLELS